MADEAKKLNAQVKELIDNVKQGFQKVGSNIQGHVSDVLSEEMKMVTDALNTGFVTVKDSGVKLFSFFAGLWKNSIATEDNLTFIKDHTKSLVGGFEKVGSFIKKIYNTLRGIDDSTEEQAKITRREHKRKLSTFKKGGKGLFTEILDWLGMPLALIGAGIGAVVGTVLAPFRAISKIFESLRINKLLGILTSKIPLLGKALPYLDDLFKWFLEIPGLRWLFKGLKLGFQKLFLPFQIILSTIDFVKGYTDAEGSIFEKIKAGIKNVIFKFFELPAKLLGSAWDWLLVQLGVKSEAQIGESSDKILRGIWTSISMAIDGWRMIFEGLGDGAKWIADQIKAVNWKGAFDVIKEKIMWLLDLPELIKQKIIDIWPFKSGDPTKDKEGRSLRLQNTQDSTSYMTGQTELNDVLNKSNEAAEARKKLQEDQLKATSETNKRIVELQKAIEAGQNPIAIPVPGGGGKNRDIPENVNDGSIFFMNMGLGGA